MVYKKVSLNGAWEMEYSEEIYTSEDNPFSKIVKEEDLAGTEPEDMSVSHIENAVPGYWEDMLEAFQKAPFYSKLKFNPEYGICRYPILGYCPDMALPNICGNFFYRRSFVCGNIGGSAAIYFEGVQNTVSVWINDIFIGRHKGYSVPFEIAVPDGILKDGENIVVLSVSNHRLKGYDNQPISGLTSRAANECTGGITGDVEIRIYESALRDAVVLISDDLKTADVKMEMREKCEFNWKVLDGEKVLKSGTESGDFSFNLDALDLWSPENPKLYSLEISSSTSVLKRIFGIRKLLSKNSNLIFNGKKYFLRGACEHGYFPETVHPDHDTEFYRGIIRKLKSLGFNFVRFHTFVPEEEYMKAADELGMLFQVECPNNTTIQQWKEIVCFCRKHPSVVIYCCGNELLIDDPFIEYLDECAGVVHSETDALFAPMSAMRGVEYFWCEPEQEKKLIEKPFKHHPERIEKLGGFSDLYCTYPDGIHSYFSLDDNEEKFDECSTVYNKPRLSHEICIDGTYTDISLKDRYKGTRIGQTEMFSSIEKHLKEKGVLKNAPIYFKNSSEWQRRVRKYCFEKLRRSKSAAGYDFLGPIDTHWHTFGYDVGMMNEFYELNPGETERNVLMYNSETVLLTDLKKKRNFVGGENLCCSLMVSHYGKEKISKAEGSVRLISKHKLLKREQFTVDAIDNGEVKEIHKINILLPEVEKPCKVKLYVTLDGDNVFAENEWEIYVFPKQKEVSPENIVISGGMTMEELIENLESGKDVLLLGSAPFVSNPLTFRIALAGRTGGNLATVVKEHKALGDFPHEGFCGWQFASLLEGAGAVCFENDKARFNPIVEVVSTHKYVIRQAAMFEYRALAGRLLVCSFNFKEDDPAANYLKAQLINYIKSEDFSPKDSIDKDGILALVTTNVKKAAANSNVAFNVNDKTAIRKK